MAGLRLNLDPTGIVTGGAQAESALDKVQREALQTEQALTRAGAKGGAAVQQMGGAATQAAGFMGRYGSRVQQAGYQVGDFAVQVGSGGSALVAFSQQGSQLLGMMGPWGAVFGAALAVALPLGGALLSSADSAKELGSQVEFAALKIDEFRSAVDNAKISTEDMRARFGEVSAEVQAAFDAIAGEKAAAAQRAIDGVGKSLSEMFGTGGAGDVRSEMAGFFDLNILMAFTAAGRESMTVARELTAEFYNQQSALAGAGGDLESQLSILTEMVSTASALATASGDVSAEEQAVIDQITEALGLTAEQVALTRELQVATFDWSAALEYAAEAAASVVDSAPGGGWLSGAISDAATLGATLWEAARAAAAARGGSVVNADPSKGPAFEGGGRGGLAPYIKPEPTLDDIILRDTPRGGSRRAGAGGGKGGGGGGKSAVAQAAEDYDRLLASLDPAVRANQEFAEAQKTVNAALKTGKITSEEAAKTLALARKEMEDATGAAGGFSDYLEIGGSAIDRLIEGTSSLKDVWKDVVKEIALAVVKKQLLGKISGGSASDSVGTLIAKGLFGGMFDSGGTLPMGQWGIVGEKGPEIVRSTAAGAVVTSRMDTAKMAQGGGGVVMGQIGVSVDDDGKIQAYVKRMGVQAAQAGASQAVGTVRQNWGAWGNEYQMHGAMA